jgi:hypothetical protein
MLGGTFGVAAIGALFQHLASNRLADSLRGTGVTAAQRDEIVHNLGSGSKGIVAGVDPHTAAQVSRASKEAFIHALSSGMWLSASVAALGALVAFTLISDKRAEAPSPARRPEAAGEALAPSQTG